jgi:hypothetical protein
MILRLSSTDPAHGSRAVPLCRANLIQLNIVGNVGDALGGRNDTFVASHDAATDAGQGLTCLRASS